MSIPPTITTHFTPMLEPETHVICDIERLEHLYFTDGISYFYLALQIALKSGRPILS